MASPNAQDRSDERQRTVSTSLRVAAVIIFVALVLLAAAAAWLMVFWALPVPLAAPM